MMPLSKLDEKVWLSDLHYITTSLHSSTKSLSVSHFLVMRHLKISLFSFTQFLSFGERNRVMDNICHIFSTLGIDEEVKQEQDQSSATTDNIISMNKRKTKKLHITLDIANILQLYDADNNLDDADNADEVEDYFKMKLSINDDESILK